MGIVNDYFSFQNGYAFKSVDFTENGEYKIIKIKELKGGSVKFFDDTAEINPSCDFDIEKYIIRKGDVLFALTGDPVSKPNPLSWVGRVSYYTHDEPALLNQRVCKAVPKGSVPNEYLYYFFRQESESFKLASKATGSASQANISTKTIEQHRMDIPDKDKMDKIVSVLRNIDEKIENNNQINRNLSEQAMAIFTDLFGDADKDATVDEVSLNVTDGVHNTVKDDSEGKFFLLSCKNIKGGSLSLGERRINQETFEKLRKRTKLEKGDILLSSVGTIGELLLMSFDPDKYEFQRSVAIIKPNSDVVSSEYLYCALLAQKQEIIRAAHGAVQQCIFISDIKGFTIHKPTSERLIQFDNAVVPMMKMIYQNEEENKRLSLLRDTLLPKLMSGELDVSELDI